MKVLPSSIISIKYTFVIQFGLLPSDADTISPRHGNVAHPFLLNLFDKKIINYKCKSISPQK